MRPSRKDDGFLTTAEAAQRLGLSLGQFRKITADLKPAKTYPNPRWRTGPQAHLWSQRQVGNLGRRKAVVAAQGRKGGARRTPEAWGHRFEARFGSAPQALGAAAEALFALNRYTRWASCSAAHRTEILDLKTQFVTLLYQLEKTDRVVRFSLTRAGKGCWACGGDNGFAGEGCERCDDTGWYVPPRTEKLLAFHFTVDGVHYSWMQPERFVLFPVKVDEEQTELAGRRETAVSMPRARFSEAKALLRWVIAAHAGAVPTNLDALIEEMDP